MKTGRNIFLLILTAMIWGVAFVFQSTGGDLIGPYSFTCLRSVVASVALLPVVKLLDRLGLTKHRPASPAEWKKLIRAGILCGLCISTSSIFQQLGLYMGVAAGKAGFLTACYIVLMPLLGLFLKRKCGWNVWIAVGITVIGLYLLCMSGTLTIRLPDIYLLICSLACALHILVVDHYMMDVDVVRMSLIQFITVSVVAAVPMFFSDMHHSAAGFSAWLQALCLPAAWTAVLYAGLMSSAVGYTLQNIGQQGVNPTVASLLMSLESVFSVLAGWLILGQQLGPRELAGCALIFAAIVFAQVPVKGTGRGKEKIS